MAAEKDNPAPAGAADEVVITRVFAAPRELVFSTWINPVHLVRWWGPRDFTNPVCDWDAKPAGKIRHVMRGPDGTDYPMGGEFREITPSSRLVLTTGALDPQGRLMFEFLHTVTFDEQQGGTLLTIRSVLTRTTPGSEHYTNGYRAGMTQSLERLEEALADPVSAREIVITRVLHAPRELVWEAWTKPEHVAKWWGPRGFTNTTKRHEFRVGGCWEHTMHGPDGTNYPNKAKFLEIVPSERITYLLGGGSDLEADERRGATFRATWTFEVVDAERTRLTGRMIFPSKEARDRVARDYGAIEGGRQTFERLGELVDAMQCEPFVIAREFNARRDLVWRAWTEQEHFSRWFGPKGCKVELRKFDLRPGGMNHYRMTTPDGQEMWGRAVYREITPPEKLVWVNSFSDAAGGITALPMSPTWPKEMLTTVTFAERGAKTFVTVHWVPSDATEAERKTFSPARTGMAGGWSGTFEQLAAYLATVD